MLVDFFANWCGPCTASHPMLEELAKNFKGTAVISKINVDKNPELTAQFKVRSIPTLFCFKNGEIVGTQNGVQSKSGIASQLNSFTNNQIINKMKNLKLAAFAVAFALLSTTQLHAQLPDPGFKVDSRTAIVITDPQNDFLSPKGVAWGVVGESVTKNNTVKNLEQLFKIAKEKNITIFVSPHYYFKHDHNWQIEGALEALMHKIKMFDKADVLKTEGFENSGADWLDQYKNYIGESNVIVTSPHKVFGPESNDLALQLRKHGFDNVILAGMSANLCVESHMRDLIESGFKVAVVKDATAAAILPGLNGYEAALVNFQMISSHVFTTQEIITEIKKSSK